MLFRSNAVLALAEIENSAAVQKAIVHYDQQMGQKLQLPTETLQELLDLHRATEKETTQSPGPEAALAWASLAQRFPASSVLVLLRH